MVNLKSDYCVNIHKKSVEVVSHSFIYVFNLRSFVQSNFKMESIEGFENLFRDSKTDHIYKKNQTFQKYMYFDCFYKNCKGRLQLNFDSKLKRIIVEHNDHSTASVSNQLEVLKINNNILKMSIDTNLKPADIYSNAIEHFRGKLPLNHEKKSFKSIKNARYRNKKSTNKTNDADVVCAARLNDCENDDSIALLPMNELNSPEKSSDREGLKGNLNIFFIE